MSRGWPARLVSIDLSWLHSHSGLQRLLTYLIDASADIEPQVGSMSDAHVPFPLESRDDGEVTLAAQLA